MRYSQQVFIETLQKRFTAAKNHQLLLAAA